MERKAELRLYGKWYMMVQRCENEDHIAYGEYGGRGICVCG